MVAEEAGPDLLPGGGEVPAPHPVQAAQVRGMGAREHYAPALCAQLPPDKGNRVGK